NIAEGYGRGTRKDYKRFLQVARGSLYELETQLLLAEEMKFLPASTAAALAQNTTECSRMFHGLLKALVDD
ncbi:MAG: four helix bundle protein, partial [Planctomycetaceae bacterium]